VLDVTEIISIIDCFVIVSASNPRQARTIVDAVEEAMKASDGSSPIGIEGLEDEAWMLLDYGEIVVHAFTTEQRAYYGLERLWSDAPTIVVDGRAEVGVGDRSGD